MQLSFGRRITFDYNTDADFTKIIHTTAMFDDVPFMGVAVSGPLGRHCLGLEFVAFVVNALTAQGVQPVNLYKYFNGFWGPV